MSGCSVKGSETLSPRERARLVGILSRLSSSFAGERAAAGLLAAKFLAKHNLMWSDLAEMVHSKVEVAEPSATVARKRDRRLGGSRSWPGYCRRRLVGLGVRVDVST